MGENIKILLIILPVFIPAGVGAYFLMSAMDSQRKKQGDKTSSLFGARLSDYKNLISYRKDPYISKMIWFSNCCFAIAFLMALCVVIFGDFFGFKVRW